MPSYSPSRRLGLPCPTNKTIKFKRTVPPAIDASVLVINPLDFVCDLLLNFIDVGLELRVCFVHFLDGDGFSADAHEHHFVGDGKVPSSEDEADGALHLSRVRLEPLGHEFEEARVAELVHAADGGAGLHRRADEALSPAELDHLLVRLVHVHARDAVHHHGAGALAERLAQVRVGGGDGPHPLEDRAVERNHQRAASGQRVAGSHRTEAGEGEARDDAADRSTRGERSEEHQHAVRILRVEVLLLLVKLTIENDGTMVRREDKNY